MWPAGPSAKTANRRLVEYIQHLYNRGASVFDAVHAILYVQHQHPSLSGALKHAWNSVESWKLELPVNMRAPIPKAILDAYFVGGLLFAFTLEPKLLMSWLATAVALLVGFDGLFRPLELTRILRSHVVLPSSFVFGIQHVALISVHSPKNRRFAGRMQFRMVRDPVTIQWLEWLCAGLAPESYIFPVTTHFLRECMTKLGRMFQTTHLKYTPAGLRAGGATQKFLDGLPLDQLKFAGGWTSVKTLEHYVQEAAAFRAYANISSSTANLIAFLQQTFPNLPSPPEVSCVALRHGCSGQAPMRRFRICR